MTADAEEWETIPSYKHLGIRLSEYSFDCPRGLWRARLIAKGWGKNQNILLYFSELEKQKNYSISLFFFTTHYRPEDGGFDFRMHGRRDDIFDLETAVGHTGRTRLLSAKLIPRYGDDSVAITQSTPMPVS
jgi:hypothetical protein